MQILENTPKISQSTFVQVQTIADDQAGSTI